MITSIAILAGLSILELVFAKIAIGNLETREYNFMDFFDLHDQQR